MIRVLRRLLWIPLTFLGGCLLFAALALAVGMPEVATFLIVASTILGFSIYVHEAAHVVALELFGALDENRVEMRFLRTSVWSIRPLSPGKMAVVALVGPLAGGCLCFAAAVITGWQVFWLATVMHAMALIPPAGDGRALVPLVRSMRNIRNR